MSKDYYATLGVSKDVTQDDLKKAYRKLAHQHHPDKATGNEEKFKEINEAYQVLKDPEKRKKYDQHGSSFEQMGGWGQATGGMSWEDVMQGFRQGGFGGSSGGQSFSFDLGDLFGDLFSGNTGFRGASSRSSSGLSSRGRNLETTVNIDFDEAAKGTTRTIQLEKFEKCTHCRGNRAEPGTAIVQCKRCGGSGVITHTQNTILGVMQSRQVCPNCQGEGKIPKQNCSLCNGDGMERIKKTLEVKIPAGIADGETIRLRAEGEISEDLSDHGDLYLQVHVRDHYKFKRNGDDVKSREPITFSQAVLGDKILVDTIDGKVELKIPAGTHSGTIFKLKKKGMPHLRSSGKGDHYVHVFIAVPERPSKKAKQLVQQLKEEGL